MEDCRRDHPFFIKAVKTRSHCHAAIHLLNDGRVQRNAVLGRHLNQDRRALQRQRSDRKDNCLDAFAQEASVATLRSAKVMAEATSTVKPSDAPISWISWAPKTLVG